MKFIQFSESRSLELRMETFNLFNTANFDLPNRFAFTPNFGKVFSAGPVEANPVRNKVLVLTRKSPVAYKNNE